MSSNVTHQQLVERITARKANIGVIGLGYVGLPLAVEFARQGFNVYGFDVDETKTGQINAGRSYIPDVSEKELAEVVASGHLRATTKMGELAKMDVIDICVPTPLRKTKDPDLSYVVKAVEAVAASLKRGQLVILESTTYPGTTDEVVQPMLEAQGLKADEDFFLAFSPERVDPGNERYNTRNTPKVIGGITPACLKAAVALYQGAIDTLVPVSSTEAAELVKILENTFRSVNIGLANEMAIVCDKLGVDVWEVIEAASTKPFGFMKFTPGPGVGGHCIPLDPHYLAWKMRTLNYKTRFIELAGELNAEMPEFWVGKVVDTLNDQGKAVRSSHVLLVGVAYKKNIDDIRESPALDVIRLLHQRGAVVDYHDPHVPVLKEDGIALSSVPLTAETLGKADCVVIVTDHTDVDYALVERCARVVVDTRNAIEMARRRRQAP